MMNPLQMVQMLRGAQNPMQTMMQLSRQNPQLNQIMQMTNGKTTAQMEQMVRQAAQQRGVGLNQLAQQLGVKLPK